MNFQNTSKVWQYGTQTAQNRLGTTFLKEFLNFGEKFNFLNFFGYPGGQKSKFSKVCQYGTQTSCHDVGSPFSSFSSQFGD